MATDIALGAACYWDASAVVSVLLSDDHSATASTVIEAPGAHILTSLCFAEVFAVIDRAGRNDDLSDLFVRAAQEALSSGPWWRSHISPKWADLENLSRRWPLRGADLWHLAAAKALEREVGPISLLTFDTRLAAAADGEGLAPPI